MNIEYKYTKEFYGSLRGEASEDIIDGIRVVVFKGHLTQMFRRLGVSQSYYSKIRNALVDLGCITVLKRGARGVDSLVVLHHPPDEMEFLTRAKGDLTESPQAARVTEQLQELMRLIGGLDVVSAIENLDRRVTKLETEAQNTGGNLGKTQESKDKNSRNKSNKR